MTNQFELPLMPEPDISGATTVSGRDLWYDRARCVWTTDPFDVWLSEEKLIKKYGVAGEKPPKADPETQKGPGLAEARTGATYEDLVGSALRAAAGHDVFILTRGKRVVGKMVRRWQAADDPRLDAGAISASGALVAVARQ